MTYKAPVRDLLFSLTEAADFGRLEAAFPAADADTTVKAQKSSTGGR